ncbi:MAG: hypothetical protein ACREE9_10420, partial [Stellaceae bacterium]
MALALAAASLAFLSSRAMADPPAPDPATLAHAGTPATASADAGDTAAIPATLTPFAEQALGVALNLGGRNRHRLVGT